MDAISGQLNLVLAAAFLLAVLIQFFYFFRFFSLLSFFKSSKNPSHQPPVSVVICAKNEAPRLQEYLPIIFNQDYPRFEVVVVNDCSVDDTEQVLEDFQRKFSNLHVVHLKEEEIREHDKKLALTLGIKGARYEHLLLTDADCKPAGDQWIREMMAHYQSGTEIVIGYGAYKKLPGLLNKLIRFDTFMGALQYLSFAIGKRPYMGVGRNLSYTKDLFFRNKGFGAQYHIRSGDDDLFINRVGNSRNIRVAVEPNTFTISDPKKTYQAWKSQKRRHITTAKHYQSGDKFRLGFYLFSQYLLLFSFIGLMITGFEPTLMLSVLTLRVLVFLFVVGKALEKLDETDLIIFSPIFEVYLLFVYPGLVAGNAMGKKNAWK
jgi:glycosyltransferase involved in cell wall biosynthesis